MRSAGLSLSKDEVRPQRNLTETMNLLRAAD
jgi:hypothetical protein